MSVERKLATVLFVDLVDSTSLVSSKDPEVVRRRVNEYFERVSHCVTTHGGIVEKFAGDAVMAAFGIPQAHEDDAERAVRAGLAILESVAELELEARAGVEAGEVVADDGDSTFATGAAVNLAARLQQAAAPGELLIGPGAHRLTLGMIEFEDVGPIDVRGQDEPVWARRAMSAIRNGGGPRSLAAPFIGREREVELLENTFDRSVHDRRPHLFTIYGEPGVGKSRLAREFAESIEGATVLAGRSLPYGEGVTYWPLAEMVKFAAGIADDDPLDVAIEKLRDTCEDEVVADLLGLASGVLEAVHGERSQQEIAWAARAWAQRMAQEQPLVLVFEDIHWAEDPLLELIEHLSEWVRDAPLLLVTIARPELLDNRPTWGGGRLRATAIELEPLARNESEELMAALLEGDELSAEERTQLLDKTEGNPLFVEETIRMITEEGLDGAAARIPDTLQALIAARIDGLPSDQKMLLQRAAVIGRIFWGGAIEHLAPEADIASLLEDLLLREFVLPEQRSTITGETAYRFKHVLIREVAYSGLSKTARAEHHARFAGWLKERAGEELLEIRAYHLDEATELLGELEGAPPEELAHEAAAALEEAGKRALAREANRSARKLFVRAVELEPTLERRYQAARSAWRLADLPTVSIEMERVRADAKDAGDPRIEARALSALAEVTIFRHADVGEGQTLAKRALEVAEPDDLHSRFDALNVLATAAYWTGDVTESERYAHKMLEVAREIGLPYFESRAAIELAGIYLARGDDEEAGRLIEEARELAEQSGSLVARAWVLSSAGDLHGHRDQLDLAEQELEQALELFGEAGHGSLLGRVYYRLARVVAQKGDFKRAERLYRDSIRVLKPLEDRGTLCESQRGLAQLLLEQGNIDEAEKYALLARETVGPQDVTSLSTTAVALGLVRAAQGRDDEAEALLREAVDRISATECIKYTHEPMRELGRFYRDRGRDEEADAVEGRLSDLTSTLRIS
jgi:class 3 adenylate cyclase/ATP/maltotriose-dependent transcriptional regulator MalT